MKEGQVEHKGKTFNVKILKCLTIQGGDAVNILINMFHKDSANDMYAFDVWTPQVAEDVVIPIYDELIKNGTNNPYVKWYKDKKEEIREIVELMRVGKIDYFMLENK